MIASRGHFSFGCRERDRRWGRVWLSSDMLPGRATNRTSKSVVGQCGASLWVGWNRWGGRYKMGHALFRLFRGVSMSISRSRAEPLHHRRASSSEAEMVRRKGSAVVGAVRDQVDFLKRVSRQNAWGIKVNNKKPKACNYIPAAPTQPLLKYPLCGWGVCLTSVSWHREDTLPVSRGFTCAQPRATICSVRCLSFALLVFVCPREKG